MLAQILELKRRVAVLLLVASTGLLVSCASQRDQVLVSDPDAKKESQIPWNRQEKWESQGAMGNITDRR
jgi:hypothetical protein